MKTKRSTPTLNLRSRMGPGLIWLLLVMSLFAPSLAQAESRPSSGAPIILDDGSWADGDEWNEFFENEMEIFGVQGAAMVVVEGGRVRLLRGYGLADAAQQMPLDPQETILRAGSIAKTLTALAVFQLAEQGRLDLDADVNRYLTRFQVPASFPEPVTARQLINMTAGFDTRAVGIRARSPQALQPLGEYLAERMPPRVLPPGRYRRYNDHEVALAGYLVEVISGLPYDEYLRRNIFEPLEMFDSNLLLPDEQLARAARGYPVGGSPDDAYPLNYYYLNDAPGAGFNTTAKDLSHYLMALVQDGSYTQGNGRKVQIVQPETARSLLSTAFAYDPLLPGSANSFDERFENGRRYLRKQGGAPGMQNNLIVLPEQGLAFYLFTNSEGTGLRNDWAQAVVRRSLSARPSRPAAPPPVEPIPVKPDNYTGIYQEISDQTSATTIVQVQALFDPDVWQRVSANPDGSLQINGRRYLALSDSLFRDPLSDNAIAFELDEQGRSNFLFQARTAYQRVHWWQVPSFQMGLLAFSVLVFLATLLATLLSWRRSAGHTARLPGLISGANLAFLIVILLLLLPIATGGDKWQFSFEPALALRLILALPVLTAASSAVLLTTTLTGWRSTPIPQRLLNVLALLGSASFLFFLNSWNLFGWRF